MRCPRCQHENEAGAKFCEECAAPMALSCARCGHRHSPTARFCPECASPTGLPQAAPTAPRFASPESYTPKHLAERILSSKAALEGACGPEDHAVRACYAARRMQESVARYAEEVRRAHAVSVEMRVGLNSGEVVVRAIGSDLHMDYTAVGETTHLAAGMEQAARAGTVLIAPATLDLVEGLVAVKPLGPVSVKGRSEPVDVYELSGMGPARTRLQAAARRGLTRFVGRDREIEALRRSLEQARAGHGQVVAIVARPARGNPDSTGSSLDRTTQTAVSCSGAARSPMRAARRTCPLSSC